MNLADNFIMMYPHVAMVVFEETDKYAQEVNDNDRLSDKIMRRLLKYFQKVDKGDTHNKKIKYIIHREISQAREEMRNRKFSVISFGELVDDDGVGAPIEFEAKDTKPLVDDIVLGEITANNIHKKITRLATSDRDFTILKAIVSGQKTNEIANALASVFGGKSDSHVRYINRFKEKCQPFIDSECVAV